MRSKPVVLVALLLAAFLVIAALIFSQALYSPSEAALSSYLRYYSSSHSGATVKAIVTARSPSRFTADMSGLVIGDSPYYNTDLGKGGATRESQGQRALPYPPDELRCVLLGSSQGDDVIFVALHRDLYNADWLVHQAQDRWSSEALQAQLSAVGCDFPANP